MRTLRGPGECVRPRLLKLSRDGLVVVNYTDGTGHLAVFTINGRLLSDKRLDDQMLVGNMGHVLLEPAIAVHSAIFLCGAGGCTQDSAALATL